MAREILLDDESVPVHVRRDECMRLLNLALSEAKRRGAEMVIAEAAYYGAKADESLEMLDAGYANTLIQTVVKGRPKVAEAMAAYHQAEVEYKNSNEAINVYKLALKSLESELAREWEQSKRTM